MTITLAFLSHLSRLLVLNKCRPSIISIDCHKIERLLELYSFVMCTHLTTFIRIQLFWILFNQTTEMTALLEQ